MKIWTLLATAAVFGALGVALAQERAPQPAAPPSTMPAAGSRAPAFRLNDQDGKAVRLADLHAGGWAVVAFYPRAATPG
jgi:cytochrome oxidase Cu insertion factor (SCO1/SenC/PrrC family)